MNPLPDLLAAISGDPHDAEAQLVLADYLISRGDPRGDLIVLDHRDRTAGLHDPEAVEQLLLLAAEYTFPTTEPLAPMLPFEGGGASPVQYEVTYEGHAYYIRYRHGDLSITIDDGAIDSGVEYPDSFPPQVHDRLLWEGEWTDEETAGMLGVISDAIRAGTPLATLQFPFMSEPLPQYSGGPVRCYRLPKEFIEPRGLRPTRYGLAARAYDRWHGLWDRLRGLSR